MANILLGPDIEEKDKSYMHHLCCEQTQSSCMFGMELILNFPVTQGDERVS
jgi:hypothetical protein